MSAASASPTKMDFLLEEARSDLKKARADLSKINNKARADLSKVSNSISEWTAQQGGKKQKNDDFQVVQPPSDTIAYDGAVGRDAIIGEEDKLPWLLEEARADVAWAASSVSKKLSETTPSLLHKAGEKSRGGGGGFYLGAAARAMQQSRGRLACGGSEEDLAGEEEYQALTRDGGISGEGGGDDDSKVSWLVAEAKADVSRAASSLSQKLSTKSLSPKARSAQGFENGAEKRAAKPLTNGDTEDDKATWLFDEAKADFNRIAFRLSQILAREFEISSSFLASPSSASSSAKKSKKRKNPSTVSAHAQQQVDAAGGDDDKMSFLMQEAQDDLKKLGGYLGLSSSAGPTSSRSAVAAATESSKIIDEEVEKLKKMEEEIEKVEEANKLQQEDKCREHEELIVTTAEDKAKEAKFEAKIERKAEEQLPTTPVAELRGEIAILKAYIDHEYPIKSDETEFTDDRYNAADDKIAPPPEEDKLAVHDDDSVPTDDNNDDNDFVPITKEDTYSEGGGHDSDEWDTMSDEMNLPTANEDGFTQNSQASLDNWRSQKAKYRPDASRDDVDTKVKALLESMGGGNDGNHGDKKPREKTAEEIANQLIEEARDRRQIKRNNSNFT
eukprot:CAMPEP_0197467178 /NCGR_PEP_ID=MMETSP1175-20131217/65431_1 /TAXON_ID=1003142 /ORGANISM="Triceratium dubium, Strain CCMP147" /LENGTH=614 /DNA_ID=CAMNT_0043003241 /DNA_START=172 /DNA_END=2016 /DNA_ORIENTATION=+